ncbi:MAG: hypothetical protein U0805_01130 [Pirellulales bacterium]
MESAPRSRWLALTYAATIFTSAFLLFQVQPMISKAILPWFGGTPAVWTTCLLFFQSVLFAGYAYAHVSHTWLSRRAQALVHIAFIVAALLLLRVLPTSSQEPSGEANPTWAILLILLATIGLPYFILSSTGPLLQAWFARSFPNRTPYRLYALSNVGSLLALVSYPFVFEAAFDLPWQARLWTIGFAAFAILCSVAAIGQRAGASPPPSIETEPPNADEPHSNPAEPTANPRFTTYILWLILPAFASIALMATTNHVSTDVAVVPLLWLVPLTLYLLTFIIAFDQPTWYRRTFVAVVTVLAIYATGLIYKTNISTIKLYDCGITGKAIQTVAELMHRETRDDKGEIVSPQKKIGFRTAVAINFVAMFGICFLCHGELARLKPPARHLTAYYLLMSAGGALGGIAVSVIAPHVFSTIFEWNLMVFASAIIAAVFVLYALVNQAVLINIDDDGSEHPNWPARVALLALLVPTSFMLLDLTDYLFASRKDVVFQRRNFFGTLTIRKQDSDRPQVENLVLLNGTTIHGSQFTAPDRREEPTSYYAPVSGIGRVITFYHMNRPPGGVRIADVGLGTGTLAAYAGKGDYLTFYEINSAVVEMSTSGEWFTYVADCRKRGAKCDIKLGDARLTLERETHTPNLPKYHVLVLDAFSGDAVPTHLLTREAYDIYLQRLATEAIDGAEGALVVHVSNRYLDLTRVVRAAAAEIRFGCVEVHSPGVSGQLINSADWMVLTRNPALVAELALVEYKPAEPPKKPVLWTDARSSLFEIVR